MARFVKVTPSSYYNLDYVTSVSVSDSQVLLGMPNSTGQLVIVCSDSAEATSVAAKIAHAYDPKA